MPRPLPGIPLNFPGRETEFVQAMWDHMAEHPASSEPGLEIFNIDNRSRRRGDPDDGSLMILDEPVVLRPKEHRGFEYSFSPEGELMLSFENLPDGAKDKWEGLSIRTHHQFCFVCGDVLEHYCRYRAADKERRKELRSCVVHHADLVSLVAGSLDDCFLCTRMRHRVQFTDPDALYPHSNLTKFRIEACWSSNDEDGNGGHRIFFAMVNPALPKGRLPTGCWNWNEVFRLQAWPFERFGHCFLGPLAEMSPIGTSDDGNQVAISRSKATNSKQSRALSQYWLQQCLENTDGKHNECNKFNDQSRLPGRVLDVQTAIRTGMVKLVCPYDAGVDTEAIVGNPYISLSHKWGSLRLPVLTTTNLAARVETGISLDELPATFQHAFVICTWFGIKWLWIDCFCILQDSASDWEREAAGMSKYYSSALLNISATAAEDGNDGCFVERNPEGLVEPVIGSTGDSNMAWYITNDHHQASSWMLDMPAFTRAWIHRERQLSPRILHFTAREIIWECCGTEGASFASEKMPGGAPFARPFGTNTKYQGKDLDHATLDDTHTTWNELCEGFSERNLTKQTDMPIVLSSLAEDFASRLSSDEYLAGLWRSKLPEALLWRGVKGATSSQPLPTEGVPSWSWMAVDCQVELVGHRESTWAKYSLAVVEEVEKELKHPDQKFGPVNDARISLTCVIRRVRFQISDDDGSLMLSVQEENWKDEPWREIGKAFDSYYGNRFELFLDHGASLQTGTLECYACFVSMGQFYQKGGRNSRDLQCLLLELVEDEEEAFEVGGKADVETVGAAVGAVSLNDDEKEDTRSPDGGEVAGKDEESEGQHNEGSESETDECASFRRVGVLDLDDLYSLKLRYQIHPLEELDADEYFRERAEDATDGEEQDARGIFERMQNIIKFGYRDYMETNLEQDKDFQGERKPAAPMLVYDFDGPLEGFGGDPLIRRLEEERVVIV